MAVGTALGGWRIVRTMGMKIIIGVGATTKLSGIKWGVATRIVWAWLLTIPASVLVAALIFYLLKLLLAAV